MIDRGESAANVCAEGVSYTELLIGRCVKGATITNLEATVGTYQLREVTVTPLRPRRRGKAASKHINLNIVCSLLHHVADEC